MKKIIVCALLSLLVIGSLDVFAKSVSYRACTSDKVPVTLGIGFDDTQLAKSPGAEAAVGRVFNQVAKSMSANELLGTIGYKAFVDGINNLSNEDRLAIESIDGPPQVQQGLCSN